MLDGGDNQKSPDWYEDQTAVIRDPGKIGLSSIDVQINEDRKFKLLGVSSKHFNAYEH